jgi:phage shock protein PspC (stress-responsive transcriptional regulator)
VCVRLYTSLSQIGVFEGYGITFNLEKIYVQQRSAIFWILHDGLNVMAYLIFLYVYEPTWKLPFSSTADLSEDLMHKHTAFRRYLFVMLLLHILNSIAYVLMSVQSPAGLW